MCLSFPFIILTDFDNLIYLVLGPPNDTERPKTLDLQNVIIPATMRKPVIWSVVQFASEMVKNHFFSVFNSSLLNPILQDVR